MALTTSLTASMSVTPLRESRVLKTTTYRRKQRVKQQQQQQPQRRVQAFFGNFSHFGDVVRRDMDFLKKGVQRGVEWANETFRIPQAKKAVDDVVWLRNLEDPNFSPPAKPPLWPQPYYPALSGMDLMMADLKALEAYVSYFYYQSKKWSKPLPEAYDAEEVADYFSHRPHVVALRLLEVVKMIDQSFYELLLGFYFFYLSFTEVVKNYTKSFGAHDFVFCKVFSSFASAAIRIRMAGLKKSLRPGSSKDIDENLSQYNFGMVLKETMLSLGPTFIKGQNVSQAYQYASYMHLLADAVGQSLSTRPDIIGPEISKALSELHDQIPPFPRPLAMKIIEEELGSPIGSFFSYISEQPVAAASFGQVYRGCTLDGSDVAVKVQRPNLRHVVVRDVYILRLGLGLLQKIAKRKSDPRLYADELGKGLVGELDYTLEAANASQFLSEDEFSAIDALSSINLMCLSQDAHSHFSFMQIPKVFQHLTRKRVLTMEWMVGESSTDLLSITTSSSIKHGSKYLERQKVDAKRRLLDLVNKGVEASLTQLLETGMLHADPHPGNLCYTASGRIGFVDFGLICRMEKKHQFAMLASIVHIVNGDWSSLLQALTEMDVVRPGTNIRRVTMDLEDALGEVELKDGIPDIKFSRVLGKIWSVALKYHFRMPPYYTLVLRSLASLEGKSLCLAVAADPSFKTFEAAYPFVVRKLLTENSAETRKILHSVVLNRKKEFRWERLALFMRVCATRKSLQLVEASSGETSLDNLPSRTDGVFDVAYLLLRLLPSKDGVVLRRLIMTADGASLVRAAVSKEAKAFRFQLCKIIADILYQRMVKALGQLVPASQFSYKLRLAGGHQNTELHPSARLSTSSTVSDFQSLLSDRRLKLILSKILNSARKEPALMLRFYWVSFVTFIAASALAFHRLLISLSAAYIGPASFIPKRFAISA
ncbi:putative aarF domain-containing protein kinase chloroplastic isoform X1 [Gossypium australe]|uniref:Putative aarF domain-containing protein kinase chloroplastic isoform X1 n=1 Tax=Gossypium australe TaxID=47621 RepID=A0A5B6WLF3_9ROSI|nr:putative aarF domain-containing protein kinase chloroplastic isoform X1 [Gossypium australe]